jgi:hypothetical protein
VIDNGQRVVTNTKFGTASPFFGEEFFFDSAITDQTSRVTVYVNTQLDSRTRTRDARLGPSRVGAQGRHRVGSTGHGLTWCDGRGCRCLRARRD